MRLPSLQAEFLPPVSIAPHLSASPLRVAHLSHILMHSVVSFAPAADICFSASDQLVYTPHAVCHLKGAAFCLLAPRPSFACTKLPAALATQPQSALACTRLSPALTSRPHSAPGCPRLRTGAHESAFSPSSPHMKTHLTASQMHNNQLGVTSPLTPP